MDWQTSTTFLILAAAGGIVLKRLGSFVRSGRAGSCGACSGCGDPAKGKAPLHLVQLATLQDLRTNNRLTKANKAELHSDFLSDVSAGAEKNG